MRLVPDTNIMHAGGYYLRAGRWPLLLAAARMGRIRLCVPEVVIRETVAHYKAELVEAQRLVNRGVRSLRHLTANRLPDLAVDDEQVSEQVAIYQSWLRGAVLEHGEVLPIPDVQHATLIDGVLSGRKPFSKGESGYRDALIWHTVMKAAANGPLTFVTNDRNDFLTAKGTALADDLVQDLAAATIATEAVRPLTQLDPVLDELLPEDTEALEFFIAFAQSSSGTKRLQSLVEDFFPQRESAWWDYLTGRP
jgi:hypothetical protein